MLRNTLDATNEYKLPFVLMGLGLFALNEGLIRWPMPAIALKSKADVMAFIKIIWEV